MQYSTNYAFKLPQLTDPANIADINYNFEWLDGNLASASDAAHTVNRKMFDLWSYGTYSGSNGIAQSAGTTRRRTIQYVGAKQGIFSAAVGTALSQQFYVFAYTQDETYIGVWKSGAFTKVSSGFTAVTSFDFKAYPDYKFNLLLANTDGSAIPYGDEYIDIWFDVSTVRNDSESTADLARKLNDIAEISTNGTPTEYVMTATRPGTGMSELDAKVRMDVTKAYFGTIESASDGSKLYYMQASEDCVVWVRSDFQNQRVLRVTQEAPAITTAESKTAWTGRASATLPTQASPWIVHKDEYIAFASQQAWATGYTSTLYVLPLKYALKETAVLTDAMRAEVANMISADYSTGENLSRVSDVYAALDEIEYYSGNRMSHTAISDAIDDNTPIRAYKIDTSPKRMSFNFDIEDAPFFPKPKVLITATMHGNERGNVLNLISFCKNLLSNPLYSDLAGQYEWHIIPVVNIWGYNHTMIDTATGNVVWYRTSQTVTIVENTSELKGGVYENAENGMSLNSDFSDVDGFTTPEARAVRDYFLANGKFIAAIDLHQWWSANQPTVMGFASMVADHQQYADKYYRCWCRMAAGAKEAEDYVRTHVDDPKTHFQMVFGFGNYQSQTAADSDSARAYFAGVGGNTLHQDQAVPFSSSFESNMNMRFLTGTTTPYMPVQRMASNVFVQRMIAGICRAAIEEFA